MYKALKPGIDVPVVAGIMPITNANQVKRSIALSGSLVPRRFLAIVDRFGSDPGCHETGRYRLRDRPDHRSDRKRCQSCAYLYDEQTGCRRSDP